MTAARSGASSSQTQAATTSAGRARAVSTSDSRARSATETALQVVEHEEHRAPPVGVRPEPVRFVDDGAAGRLHVPRELGQEHASCPSRGRR